MATSFQMACAARMIQCMRPLLRILHLERATHNPLLSTVVSASDHSIQGLAWLNMMEFLTFFRSQSTASNVGLGNIAAVVTNALNTYSNNSAVMHQRFGYSPLTLLLVAALTVGLVCRYADSQFIKLFCLLSVTAALIE